MAAFAELPRELLPSGHTLISPLTSIAPIHLYRGELERARELCVVYARLEGSIDVQERSCFAAGRAATALAEGQFEEALTRAEDALATRALGSWPQNGKLGLVTALEAAIALGRADRVEALLSAPETQPVGMRSPLVVAQVHRFRGRLAESPELAESEFGAAERILSEIGLPFWLAVVQLEHAHAALAHGGSADVRTLLAEARLTFERLGARPWLERLAAVEGGTLHAAAPEVAG
jgi:hypothetical protein